ncbi:NmrA family NAD(P)-binding protein [Liquorilactobacillus mali]|uniref:NmrA-like protein n=1 Tax=Liquorilactobacillus mali KCTC 3596 = DSM 20444 TaxID=1046596 RepID=J0URW4_9LACO|nr:NmrA family NAD(P)-binding protein [Liquorilactobacillus mali]EJE99360.1 NmrA-like protein [Liquorilactobacillus mali KCTC 3596 = DSM 20444]KRN09328.1 NmrA-like protein [Liquorilactobacillus mali KCTC 3596 = DSM 20444]QFQ74670.1 NAD(P)H-binding protein [Liquorilactobacillus mali]
MKKIILTGVDGNLGSVAASQLMKLTKKENLIFCGYSTEVLDTYAKQGVETRQTDFNTLDGLADKFNNGEVLALISMPFVGKKRQQAHKNVIDAAKEAGVKKIIYTSLVNAADPTNPSIEKIDHAFTEEYIKKSGLDYIFLRNSQYAEAMITNYFTFVHQGSNLQNNQGDGKMAYISRKDCAKAVAYALLADDLHYKILNINGKQLMTISDFIEIGNKETGNHVKYQFISDEENYAIFDAMGVPRTTEGKFKKDSEAPFSSEGMVTFGQAIRENKMANFTKDFEYLTGDKPISVQDMFENSQNFQIGQRHSLDK